MFALIDCNNFYASCERLFRPDLREKPIIVLSGNDGCVIARSNEAKACGIAMGEPYYKIKDVCRHNKIHIFSTNFTLYRDISQRVMSLIEASWEDVEIYSVDEAFLDLSSMRPELRLSFCTNIQAHILKCTGIPVSIGLGKTKTLSKLSNFIAKRSLKTPVFDISTAPEWLEKTKVGDVWGVGRQLNQKLMNEGIQTAHDLANADKQRLKQRYGVVMMRMAMELQGISCMTLADDHAPKQSILSSRSFSDMITDYAIISQAVSAHCASVYEKLRAQQSVAQRISVFLRTNRFREDLAQHQPSAGIRFITPTDDVRIFTEAALTCLKECYRPGFQYKKTGVLLEEISNNNKQQTDLFHAIDEGAQAKNKAFLSVFDQINQRYGKDTLRLAAEGFNNAWDPTLSYISPAYTTRWSDIPRIKNGT